MCVFIYLTTSKHITVDKLDFPQIINTVGCCCGKLIGFARQQEETCVVRKVNVLMLMYIYILCMQEKAT